MVKIPNTADTEVAVEDLCIGKFMEWWSAAEMADLLSKMSPGLVALLVEHDRPSDRKLAEMLYNSVGARFLRNVDNSVDRRKDFLKEILKAAVAKRCVRKEDIVSAAMEAAGDDQRGMIRGIEDVPLLKATNRLCMRMAAELRLPLAVAEKERAEYKPDTEVVEPRVELSPLYDYQYTTGRFIRGMLEGTELDDYGREVKRKMFAVPTGSGKTRLVVETLIEWLNEGKPSKNEQQKNSKLILWIAQSRELCEQAFSTFRSIFESIGRRGTTLHLHRFWGEGGAPPNLGMDDLLAEKGVIVATIQSLDKPGVRLDALGRLTSCIVVDEAHHAVADSYTRVLREMGFNWNNRKTEISERGIILLGLTATPFRGTGNNTETRALERRLNGVYFPTIPYANKIENFKPHALIDCQTFAYVGEYVRILGERSYDRDGFINEEDYFWEIARQDGAPAEAAGCEDAASSNACKYEKIKNITHRFSEPGKYDIILKVVDNEGESDVTRAQIYIESMPESHGSHEQRQKELYQRLISRKILCEVKHKILPSSEAVTLDEAGARHLKRFGEFGKKTIESIGDDFERNRIILEEIHRLRNLGRKKILFFGCSVNHSRHIAMCLKTVYGMKARYVDSKMDYDSRLAAIENFRRRDLEILCNFDILTTGFDAPNIDCVFVGRPVRSTLLYTQMIGRGMRGTRSHGTEDVLIVDIDDNFQLQSYCEPSMTKLGWTIFREYWKPWEEPGSRDTFKHEEGEEQAEYEEDEDRAAYKASEGAWELPGEDIVVAPLSHSCSRCKKVASGVGEIRRVFGIEGPSKILVDCLKNKDYRMIPQECEQCRRKKQAPVTEDRRWSYLVANL